MKLDEEFKSTYTLTFKIVWAILESVHRSYTVRQEKWVARWRLVKEALNNMALWLIGAVKELLWTVISSLLWMYNKSVRRVTTSISGLSEYIMPHKRSDSGALWLIVVAVISAVISAVMWLLWMCYKSVRSVLSLVCSLLEYFLHKRRDKERRVQENEDRDMALAVAMKYVSQSGGHYKDLEILPDIGSRLQKYWFRANCQDGSKVIITMTKVSPSCPVNLIKDMSVIRNKLFPDIKGAHLQPVLDVQFFCEEGQLLVVQPYHQQGSLKDFVYQRSPDRDWSNKYYMYSSSHPPTATVARIGRQVLEAVKTLYQQGFYRIGHIQTGNIFMDGSSCRLGGYENAVFGYKTRLFHKLTGHMQCIDLIMFGHVLFEMACGYELSTLVPSEKDLEKVTDSTLLDVFLLIFRRDSHGNFSSTLEQVLQHHFFQSVEGITSGKRRSHLPRVTIVNREVKRVLSKVRQSQKRSLSSHQCTLQ